MYRAMGFAHATAHHHLQPIRSSSASEHGQGTVEYIGLILLLAAVMAFVATKSHGDGIGKTIVDKISSAIDSVSMKR